jgi:hypothetical protein
MKPALRIEKDHKHVIEYLIGASSNHGHGDAFSDGLLAGRPLFARLQEVVHRKKILYTKNLSQTMVFTLPGPIPVSPQDTIHPGKTELRSSPNWPRTSKPFEKFKNLQDSQNKFAIFCWYSKYPGTDKWPQMEFAIPCLIPWFICHCSRANDDIDVSSSI